MKLTIPTAPLALALRFIRPHSSSFRPSSVWLRVQGDILHITQHNPSDNAPMFLCRIPAEGVVENRHEGTVGVEAGILARVLHMAPQFITLDIPQLSVRSYRLPTPHDGDTLRVEYPSCTFSLPVGEQYGQYQEALPAPAAALLPLDAAALAAALAPVLRGVMSAVDMDSLSCVHLHTSAGGEVRVEAMDGHQYCACVLPGSGWGTMLPPAGILLKHWFARLLLRLLRSAYLGDNVRGGLVCGEKATPAWLHLCGDSGEVFIPLAHYTYPNTSDFLAKARTGTNTLTASGRELKRAFSLLAAFTTKTSREVSIIMEAGGATVQRAKGMDGIAVDVTLDAETSGNLRKIAFPAEALRDLLRHFGADETITLRMLGAESACLITGDAHPHEETVVMPIKITEVR